MKRKHSKLAIVTSGSIWRTCLWRRSQQKSKWDKMGRVSRSSQRGSQQQVHRREAHKRTQYGLRLKAYALINSRTPKKVWEEATITHYGLAVYAMQHTHTHFDDNSEGGYSHSLSGTCKCKFISNLTYFRGKQLFRHCRKSCGGRVDTLNVSNDWLFKTSDFLF